MQNGTGLEEAAWLTNTQGTQLGGACCRKHPKSEKGGVVWTGRACHSKDNFPAETYRRPKGSMGNEEAVRLERAGGDEATCRPLGILRPTEDWGSSESRTGRWRQFVRRASECLAALAELNVGSQSPKHQDEIKMGHKSTFTPLNNGRRGSRRASRQELCLHQTLGMARLGSLGKGLKT